MVLPRPFKLVIKEVLELEWLLVTIKTLLLPLPNRLVSSLLIGLRLKEITLSWKEKISDNSSVDLLTKELRIKLLVIWKTSNLLEINCAFLLDLHLTTNI